VRLLILFALLGSPFATALASAERVDELTQAALALDANRGRGESLYQANCAQCHGSRAQGDPNSAIPTLAGQRFNYLVRQLANFTGHERESVKMERIVQHRGLGEPQTWVDIAAYLNNLPAKGERAVGTGARVALGRGIFQMQCASCHKADGRGDDDGFVPSLRNQNYPYLLSQLTKLPAGFRHNVDEDLLRFWQSLDEDDIVGTADYLSRLSGPGRVHKVMRGDGTVVD
jgi:cytochrome c553